MIFLFLVRLNIYYELKLMAKLYNTLHKYSTVAYSQSVCALYLQTY